MFSMDCIPPNTPVNLCWGKTWGIGFEEGNHVRVLGESVLQEVDDFVGWEPLAQDQLIVSKLRPMCDIPREKWVLVWYEDEFEKAKFTGSSLYCPYLESDIDTLALSDCVGWIPMPVYERPDNAASL